MTDQNGGSGPYLTKDQFHQWKDEYHLVQLRNEKQRAQDKQDILNAIERSAVKSREDCREDAERNERRIEKLENSSNAQKFWSGLIALVTSVVAAVAGWFAIKGG